jgi:hypothetical protein
MKVTITNPQTGEKFELPNVTSVNWICPKCRGSLNLIGKEDVLEHHVCSKCKTKFLSLSRSFADCDGAAEK